MLLCNLALEFPLSFEIIENSATRLRVLAISGAYAIPSYPTIRAIEFKSSGIDIGTLPQHADKD